MRSAPLLALLVLVGCVRGQTPSADPDSSEQKKILADAAEFALRHEQSLPNFLCTQTTQRFIDYSGKSGFRPVDLIVERLTYFEHKEDYKVFEINGVPSNLSHHEVGGTTSSGEFGSILKGIFWPEANAQFTWERYYTLRGRRMHVYSYRVPASQSDYHVVVPMKKLDLVTSYHGLIFIDERKHFVHRITLHPDDIPASFPVQEIALVLDYEYTRIGGSDYLLPLEFELRSREGSRLIKNDVTYDGYRKFEADTSISFGSQKSPEK
ncbi:MAG TPA: hypothetical protein VEV37_13585 [Bryobacteraceae bacterium]|nr:hypothetical protein [Bryobacteraceae bacterium]